MLKFSIYLFIYFKKCVISSHVSIEKCMFYAYI